MDNAPYVALGLAALLVLITAMVLGRRASKKTRASMHGGDQASGDGRASKQSAKLRQQLNEIGRTVVLTATADRAHEIVLAAASKKNDYSSLEDGSFGIAFMTPTDAVVTLVRDDLGTRVHVDRFREHHGLVMVAPLWKRLRENIVEAAAAGGVPSHTGPVQTYTRGPGTEDDHVEWALTP